VPNLDHPTGRIEFANQFNDHVSHLVSMAMNSVTDGFRPQMIEMGSSILKKMVGLVEMAKGTPFYSELSRDEKLEVFNAMIPEITRFGFEVAGTLVPMRQWSCVRYW
jgi:hypothetical protein